MNHRFSLIMISLLLALSACITKAPPAFAAKPPLPKTEAACVAKGGEWILAGPQNVARYCFLKTTDGGKACKTSNQCQSECVERKEGGACQRSCRLSHAAIGSLSTAFNCSVTTESRSGLSVTGPMGDQLRVLRDHRAGLRWRAFVYKACRAARMAWSSPA